VARGKFGEKRFPEKKLEKGQLSHIKPRGLKINEKRQVKRKEEGEKERQHVSRTPSRE